MAPLGPLALGDAVNYCGRYRQFYLATYATTDANLSPSVVESLGWVNPDTVADSPILSCISRRGYRREGSRYNGTFDTQYAGFCRTAVHQGLCGAIVVNTALNNQQRALGNTCGII